MDHYERLGVDRGASQADLRRAYRRLAARHHPDRNADDVVAATKLMAALNEAYETLTDPVRRIDYDRRLARETPAAPDADGHRPPPAEAARRTSAPPPPDDPVRRARREAKEREAAAARARGYRDPGPTGRMGFRKPR